MKHITITSILALSITCPAFANITTSNVNPTCDEATIGTTSGSTEMEAQWNRNTINLKWYGANGEITNVGNTSKTCSYDGIIVLPSAPTRPGYTFDKWVVRAAGFNLATLASSIDSDAIDYGYKNDSAGKDGEDSYNTGNYGITTDETWVIEFNYGNVKGVSKCSTISGDYAVAGTPGDTKGGNCWCQASGFDAEKDGTYLTVASPSWVFFDGIGSPGECAFDCANTCAYGVQLDSRFRSAVYGVTETETTGTTETETTGPTSTTFDLSTLASSISTNGTDYGYWDDMEMYNINTYGITTAGEWASEFSYGNVKGISKCSAASGNYAVAGTSGDARGGNCWCQASGFDAEKDGTYLTVSSPSWVYGVYIGKASDCEEGCANECAGFVRDHSNFRSALYGITQ